MHYRRDHPPFKPKLKPGQAVVGEPADHIYEVALPILQRWLAARPRLQQLLGEPQRVSYEWGPNRDGRPLRPGLHDAGIWFYMPLREWCPPPPAGTVGWKVRGWDLSRAIHASNMYVLHSVVVDGLEPGPDLGRGNVRAVYAFPACGDGEAASSSGYAVYSDLAGMGIVFSPRMELAVQLWRSGEESVGKISVGGNQWALRPGVFHLTGIWIHALAESEMRSDAILYTAHDEWFPEYEMMPRTL